MGRSPRNPSEIHEGSIKKGPWTPEEDQLLLDYINKYGHSNWKSLPDRAGLNRCGKSCRLRWCNYLRPDIKRGNFTSEEEQMIIHLHSSLGNKWSMIASSLPGRTDNEIKNFWNTRLRKKLVRLGMIYPNTGQIMLDYFRFPVDMFVNVGENIAKIQLLQSILQILNTKNTLGRSFMNPFHIPTAMPNLESMNSQLMLDDASKMSPEVGTVNSSAGSKDNHNAEPHWLPRLVPAGAAAAEISAGDEYDQSLDDAPVVDEDSFWRDIFVESFLASSSDK